MWLRAYKGTVQKGVFHYTDENGKRQTHHDPVYFAINNGTPTEVIFSQVNKSLRLLSLKTEVIVPSKLQHLQIDEFF